MTETLELAQTALLEKPRVARKKAQKRSSSKKKELRARVSEKTQLVWLAQDSRVNGRYRLEAIKLQLVLRGKLPVDVLREKYTEEPNDPITPPSIGLTGADLAPARPV
jgi:hypothetical protein